MLDHLGLTVSDLGRSQRFYEKALAPLGYAVRTEYAGRFVGFGGDARPTWLGVGAAPKTGTHIAFEAPDRATVGRFHAPAIAAGGRDNGAPGLRPHYHPNYYGAFVLDPDGHNIEAVCHRPER
ncbi:MAG TPA: VOC family protein [Myxococcota bacterium]|nr:VOC family protein [Myxococcota bacterium]